QSANCSDVGRLLIQVMGNHSSLLSARRSPSPGIWPMICSDRGSPLASAIEISCYGYPHSHAGISQAVPRQPVEGRRLFGHLVEEALQAPAAILAGHVEKQLVQE